MRGYYALDGHDVVPCADVIAWAKFFERTNRIVRQDSIGDVRISTVFLGIDHRILFGDDGPPGHPIVFETMIFGGEHDQYLERCSTWDEAERMHAEAMALVCTKAQS